MVRKTSTTLYVCTSCGEEYIQWQGKCANCGEWNTLKEFQVDRPTGRQSRTTAGPPPSVTKLNEVAEKPEERYRTGISECDRVLGGGIVPGSVLLVGGDPGIGKSTLLLQVADTIAGQPDRTVLYVSGEESVEQIKLRANRLGITAADIHLLAATEVGQVEAAVREVRPSLTIVDSIQTMHDPQFPSTPGSIVQVRESAMRLQQLAKQLALPLIMVGHITKEGTVAGPRTLEHLVDAVIYLEGEPERDLRVLRSVKNRFGSVNEVGLFVMDGKGLREVSNPAQYLLEERVAAPGTVLTAIMEGTRPVLIEVQALTVPSAFGYPRRTASGFDLNRLNLLLAVLQRRAGVNLTQQDVFVNIVGGLKVKDPSVDLAVCAALASAAQGETLPEKLCVIGEVGLAGEVRRAWQQERREKMVRELGYQVVPFRRELQGVLRNLFAPSSRPQPPDLSIDAQKA
jgi:DNA repair protein RadA/Sms